MKKKVKVILISIFLLIASVITINILDSKKEYFVKKTELKYTLPITYVIADSNTAPKNITTSELHRKYSDSYIMPVQSYESVEKDKNGNYTAKINNANEILIDSLTSYGFGLNDNNGNVINDVKYDKKTRIITIPAHYYEDNPEKSPIRMEILSLMTMEELKNVKTDVTVNKVFDYDKTSITTALDVQTSISIGNYKELKNLRKENIDVYLNDGTIKLKNDDISFDPTSGVITIPKNTLSIKNIEVDIKDTIVDKAKGLIKTAKAYTAPTENYFINIDEPENIPGVGSIATAGRVTTFYRQDEKYDMFSQSIYENGPLRSDRYEPSKLKERWPHAYEVYEKFNSAYDGMPYAGNEYDYDPYNFPYLIDIHGLWNFSDGGSLTFPASEPDGYNGQDIGFWVKLYCMSLRDHIDSDLIENNGGGLPIEMEVLAQEGNTITLAIRTKEKFNSQKGGAVYRFKWGNDTGKIKVQKRLKDGNTDVPADENNQFAINLYKGQGCNIDNKISTVTTDESGIASFDDVLEFGDYSINETLTPEQEKYWKPLESCKNVTVDATDSVTNYVESPNYTNIKKKYCYAVRKTDAETGSEIKGNFTFLSNGDSKTVDNNSVAVFGPYDYKDSYIVEEQRITDGVNVGGSKYWTNASPITIDSSKIVEATYNNGQYNCSNLLIPEEKITNMPNNKKYYCLKVKKVDKATGNPLQGATFETTLNGSKVTATSDEYGIATFMLGSTTQSTFNVVETKAPSGYELPRNSSKSVPVTAMSEGTTEENSTNVGLCEANADAYIYEDSKLLMNFYKVTENENSRAGGAEFKVQSGNKYLKVKDDKVETKDSNGITKSCYVYSGKVDNENDASILTSDSNGEVCVSKIPQGEYIAKEITPAKYHTFGSKNTINLQSKTTFDAMSNTNRFINYPTYFEFTKEVTETSLQNGKYDNIVTEELKKIEFNIFDEGGNVLTFTEGTINGNKVYEYAGNNIDGSSSTSLSSLHLDDLRKIRIQHLPWGTYSIKEKNSNVCDSASNYSNCVGYYYPDYTNDSSHKFTIDKCSSEFATSCSSNGISTQKLNNEPTEISFTKKDFYNYEDASDIVDFENDKERNDFDRIDFKIKDENGKYLTLEEVGTSGTCTSDDSYREYRYIQGKEEVEGGTTLHTCGGHIKITNLCRGKTYIVEEVSVPEDSVFVKQVVDGKNPEASYKIPCTKGEVSPESSTKVINDKGTRVRFEKRDSKYNYLIPDETTTFEVYRCKKGVDCNPADNKDENGKIIESDDYKLVKFSKRSVIDKDEEDPVDAEGLAGVEVYKAMSDSDVESGESYVTELHPYKGILVLRYLQSGYSYVLVETIAPKNYKLPVGRNAQTKFTVTNETVEVEEVDVPNKPTSIIIKKYTNEGNLITGAQFKIYEGTTCDANLSAMNQPKRELSLKTIRDGVYENRPEKDTSVITTCTDKEGEKCSNIKVNELTKLTYTDYLGTWAEYSNASANDKEQVELKEGEALVQYLEYGHCYIIEEVKAPKGYSLPKKDEDRFTMVTIEENDSYEHTTEKTLVNTPTPFTFYKFDEFNKLLDGAEFKLQKLDKNKKYQDITVKEEEKDGKLYYKVDKDETNKTIKTKDGSATVYYLEEGQYRIIETKAAEGKELTKNPNIATFFVDESGNVHGSSIIVNKGKTEKIKVISSAKSELIINVSTGQTVIKYGLIISIILGIIVGLIILKKKVK